MSNEVNFVKYSFGGRTNAYIPGSNSSGDGVEFQVKPVVTPVDLPTVNQGVITQAVQDVDAQWPNMSFYFYDYTGTGGYNRSSETGAVGVLENTPGSYTMKVRAAWPFGMSDEKTINIVITPFTLNEDTMFGGVDGFQVSASLFSNWTNQFIPKIGAVVDDNGTYTWDESGDIVADAANCVGFWDFGENVLLAFRYNSSGTLEAPYEWQNITLQPTQGLTFTNGGSAWTSVAAQNTAANASSINGYRLPFGGYYNGGLGSTHYLSIAASDNVFANFGSRNSDWSYGFVLQDTWIGSATACQLMAPANQSEYFVSAINGYGIGSSPFENVVYGNNTSGPFSSSTNGASWDISTTNWVIGTVGDLVVVTFDGASSKDWKVYVEGVLIFSSGSVDTYMSSTTSGTEVRLGDITNIGPNQTGYPLDYGDVSGWYARIDKVFVANGTAFNQTQVTELTTNKADLTGSTNYGDINVYATIDGSGVTSVKGDCSYSRGDIDVSTGATFSIDNNKAKFL